MCCSLSGKSSVSARFSSSLVAYACSASTARLHCLTDTCPSTSSDLDIVLDRRITFLDAKEVLSRVWLK